MSVFFFQGKLNETTRCHEQPHNVSVTMRTERAGRYKLNMKFKSVDVKQHTLGNVGITKFGSLGCAKNSNMINAQEY